MKAQLMNSNNDNGDDHNLNNLLFILLDQEKSQVLSSGISKDLEIGSSKGTGFTVSWSAFIVIMADLLSVLHGCFKSKVSCIYFNA